MSSPIYAWVYSDPFHSIILGVTSSVAFFSNSLLLYIISTAASDHMGSYRYLLAFFAMCNLTTTLGHVFVQGFCHLTSDGFYFFPRDPGSIVFGVPLPSIYCLMFIVTYYQVFLILAYHFIYRYKTVTRGISPSFTDNWTAQHWVAAAIFVYFLYIGSFVTVVGVGMLPSNETRALVPVEVMETYGLDLSDPHTGFIVLAMRRFDAATNTTNPSSESFIAISCCMILFGGTAAVIVFCIYETSAAIKSSNTVLTPTTRRMHKQLFRALLIQTSIPCIFSYTPLATILLFGAITGISLGAFGNVLFLTTAIFPSVDAFFVLYFITKFRIAVIKLFRLPFKNTAGSSIEHKKGTLAS